VRAGAPKAGYQIRETGAGDQAAMLRGLELSEAAHRTLAARCAELGIEFMSTPFDAESAAMLVSLGVRRLKIPSGEITNKPLVESVASHGLPLIVSTGMSDLQEVSEALDWIRAARPASAGREDITLLHCTSNYPAAVEDVNLMAMKTLADRFHLPVGYSDHTNGIAVTTAAVALGATVIEKHFTLDKGMDGPDHRASLDPIELGQMVAAVRAVGAALGDGEKSARASELPVRDVARRSVTLIRDARKGDVLATADLSILRPGNGIAPKHYQDVVGRPLAADTPAGTTLTWDHLA
jgi:N,N'-diacetyllegionaminate synthase